MIFQKIEPSRWKSTLGLLGYSLRNYEFYSAAFLNSFLPCTSLHMYFFFFWFGLHIRTDERNFELVGQNSLKKGYFSKKFRKRGIFIRFSVQSKHLSIGFEKLSRISLMPLPPHLLPSAMDITLETLYFNFGITAQQNREDSIRLLRKESQD